MTIEQGNLFEAKPDARQGGNISPSRFRQRYRQLTSDEIILHDAVKAKAEELEGLFNLIPSGRYRSLAFTALEESVMWAIKELTGPRN